MVAPNTDGYPPDRPVAGYLKTRLLQLTFTRSAKVSARKATAVLNSVRKNKKKISHISLSNYSHLTIGFWRFTRQAHAYTICEKIGPSYSA